MHTHLVFLGFFHSTILQNQTHISLILSNYFLFNYSQWKSVIFAHLASLNSSWFPKALISFSYMHETESLTRQNTYRSYDLPAVWIKQETLKRVKVKVRWPNVARHNILFVPRELQRWCFLCSDLSKSCLIINHLSHNACRFYPQSDNTLTVGGGAEGLKLSGSLVPVGYLAVAQLY